MWYHRIDELEGQIAVRGEISRWGLSFLEPRSDDLTEAQLRAMPGGARSLTAWRAGDDSVGDLIHEALAEQALQPL
ncbi:MAG: hypothetical protein H0V07_07890 [Propionibacteriales bacterium]|nr:hypothetical protein [Propionibacteriales bacterium]MBA3690615.1 hypothetical protein [Actinomycetota bacterium]